MNIWLTGIEISIEREKYFVYSLYHSPSASHAEFIDRLDDFFENIQLNGVLILIGDFNIDLATNSFYADKLNSLIEKYGLYQTVQNYTRITKVSATKIDLILTMITIDLNEQKKT